MARRDRREYSTALPTLKPEDIAPAKEAVLTCVKVEDKEFDDGKRLYFHYSEFPDKPMRIPVTSMDEVIESLGDDDENWKTQIPVQVVKVMNPTSGKMQDVLHIAPADEWDERIAAYRKQIGASSRGSRSGRKATRR